MLMKVLINNLFQGVLARGISTYTHNLSLGISQIDHKVTVIESSSIPFSPHFPRFIFNILFIFWEQIVIPIRALFHDRVIFPYNSASLLLSVFSNKQMLIIHDFIPYDRNFSISLLYLKFTVFVHSKFRRDVAFITSSVESESLRRGYFRDSKRFIIPNTFFDFQQNLAKQEHAQITGDYILLCSGMSENKDLVGAIRLARMLPGQRFLVLGASSERNRELAGLSIKFLPQVSAEMVANVYKFAKYVWVHSNNEGFGRSIVEARLAGKVVIASNIEAFRAQSDSSVFLYGTEAQFIKSVSDASSYVADPYVCKYNSIAIRSLDEWLT